ncbi:2-oxoacid-dependent dioxygenase [Klebsormidium nitens]|uniref:2-oxoacid-dependent dioxygenase n=1 Tax=Klebsormidium nitens TaxID=105231 RepID=A0A0U9HJD0_KLENI|nr:2-oxoacid-dependent dioxygenase [Klebsormidium nitens]|eukprot:GAQ81775.1 2-oxoacid-dependent dioxygenase [Klebsormidium nitens]
MGVQLPPSAEPAAIDSCFIIPEEHRPKTAHNEYISSRGEEVPVIDLEHLRSEDDGRRRRAIAAIGDACEHWGFFQVTNHGVPPALIDEVKAQARRFFELPLEEKRRVRRTFENVYGYYESELTKNVRDWKELFDYGPKPRPDLRDDAPENVTLDGHNQWPEAPPGFRATMENWFSAMERLGRDVLHGISASLGLPPTEFDPHYANHSSFVRLNYYRPCPNPALTLGVNRHYDAGALTIVGQDGEVGGLQVQKGGEWVGIEPRRDAFVINIGDMMQVWSNGKYKSPLHRVVVNESRARFSVPFFYNPAYSTDVAPVPQLLSAGQQPAYRPINWGDFRSKRAKGDYADFGEEVQIAHYAL